MPRKPTVRFEIGDYEGSSIVGSAIKLVGGGTGLNDSLTLDARRFHRNEIVAVLVRGRIKHVGYDDADKDEPDECIEVGVLDIAEGTLVDLDLAEKMIREANERVARQRAELDGQDPLFSEQT